VSQEVQAKRRVPAAPLGQPELTMEVRIYRECPTMARHAKPGVQALWEFLGAPEKP
jgi:hypothetical protein